MSALRTDQVGCRTLLAPTDLDSFDLCSEEGETGHVVHGQRLVHVVIAE